MLPFTPDRLRQLLESSEAQRLSAPARERLEWIAAYVMSGDSISETCERLGIARSTFHRWLDRFDPEDLTSLEERAPAQRRERGSAVPPEIVALIREYRECEPLMGKERIRELLSSEHGLHVSASSIGRVIERECLYFGSTPLHWRKRIRRERGSKREMHNGIAAMEEKAIGVQRAESSAPTSDRLSPIAEPSSCACAWCRFWGTDMRHLRRFLGIASVLVNVVMLGMMLGTAFWERANDATTRADLSHNAHSYYSPVSPYDER